MNNIGGDNNENNKSNESVESEFQFSTNLSLEELRQKILKFATDRDWCQYHKPRNLCFALVGEVGEIAEHFQWREDKECLPGLPDWTEDQRTALGEELSDVLIYLVRLAERCHIDLPTAVLAKMVKNSIKYPVEKAYGSSKKYNQL